MRYITLSLRSGLYTTVDFITKGKDATQTNPTFYADFYEDYRRSEPLIESFPASKLLANTAFYPPNVTTCANNSLGCLNSCSKSLACTEREAAHKECMVVAMMYDYYDPGFLQAALANLDFAAYFCFLGYSGMQNYALQAQAAGEPVLFYHYVPDLFHIMHAGKFGRVFLPLADAAKIANATGTFGENGYGEATDNPIDCDFPTSTLLKYAANVIAESGLVVTLAAKFALTDLAIGQLLQLYLDESQATDQPADPYFAAACTWVKASYATWSVWLDRLPLCTFNEHIAYVVNGCGSGDEVREIVFAWQVADPTDPTLPYACDGGLATLPSPLYTSRKCDWLQDNKATWTAWLATQPKCDSTFYDYRVSSCDASAKRTVTYYWLLPSDQDPAQSAECTGGDTLPASLKVDCEYMPYGAPAFQGVAAFAAILAALLVAAMGFVFCCREYPIIKRSQYELLLLMILGGVMICGAAVAYAGKATHLLCALRPVLLSTGFTTIFGALLVKSVRVYRVFMAKGIKKITVRTSSLFKLFAVLLAIDVAIIAAWFIADFPSPTVTWTDAVAFRGQVDVTACKSSSFIFTALLIFWKTIVLLSGLYVCFLIRNVSSDFQESIWMFGSALTVLMGGLVLLPLAYLVTMAAATFFVFLAAMLLICVTIVMALMLVPKMVRLKSAINSRRSTSATTGGTMTVDKKRSSVVSSSGAVDGGATTTLGGNDITPLTAASHHEANPKIKPVTVRPVKG